MEDYYQQNYRQYYAATYNIDPTSFLKPVVKALKSGASILDVGCGSGRDLAWLQKRGYRVTGFERSAGLAALARKNAGCEVILGDFETYDFSLHRFDAILLCGALVHIAPARLLKMLGHIIEGVRDGGIILLSLKAGDGWKMVKGKCIYYLWKDGDLRDLTGRLGLGIITFQQNPSKLNKRDTWLSYVLQKGRVVEKAK